MNSLRRPVTVVFAIVAIALLIGSANATEYGPKIQYFAGHDPAAKPCVYSIGLGDLELSTAERPVAVPPNECVGFAWVYYDESCPVGDFYQEWVTDLDEWSDPIDYDDKLQSWWDWDGDGYCDVADELVSDREAYICHVFDTPGTYQIRCRIRDMGIKCYDPLSCSYYHQGSNDLPNTNNPCNNYTEWDDDSEYVYVKVVNDTSPPPTPIVTAYHTNDPTRLHFESTLPDDEESYTVRYSTWLVNQSGQVVKYGPEGRHAASGGIDITLTGLNLNMDDTYYVHVKVWNGLGLTSEGVSSGVKLDTADPIVTFTTPQGDMFTIAPDAGSVVLAGKAIDVDTEVVLVQLQFAGGNWVDAQYNPQTFAWTYNWQLPNPLPQSVTICVRATDSIGNTCAPFCREVTLNKLPPRGVRFVDAHCEGPVHDGRSWATAYTSLWDAVGWNGYYGSEPDPEQVEVWVADGTYTDPWMRSLMLDPHISLYGGFRGITDGLGETVKEQRDWQQNICTVALNNQYIGITGYSSPNILVIDGFVIQNGSPGISLDGASIDLCAGVTISHNTIRANYDGIFIIYGMPGKPVRILNNWIEGNISTGIRCYSDMFTYENNGPVVIANNTITNNGSTDWPNSGISIEWFSPTVVNNILAGNYYGIANMDASYSPAPPAYCCFFSNTPGGHVYQMDSPQGNGNFVDQNPLLDGVHIAQGSPCVDAGDSTATDPADTDIDGQLREQPVGSVDIGADELAGCERIAIAASTTHVPWGDSVTITATVVDLNGQPVIGRCVEFSATGHASVNPTLVRTSSQGTATATLTDNCVEVVRVTATVVDACGVTSTVGVDVEFKPDSVLVEADPEWVQCGGRISLSARVLKSNGQPRAGLVVAWQATQPTLAVISNTTDSQGRAFAEFECTDCPPGYYPFVTASVTDGCNRPVSGGTLLWCETQPLTEVFFCLDCTGSMRSGGDHSAVPSVIALLDEMSSVYGVRFRVGCVRFNEGQYEPYIQDSILQSECKSLAQFTTLSAFTEWLNSSYEPEGGDRPELQLDALHFAAQDMSAHAVSPRRYIVLITDSDFHENEGGSTVTMVQVVSELTATGCPVFISLWGWSEASYQNLIVNGGAFDPVNPGGTDQPGNWKYPLANLRARILADL